MEMESVVEERNAQPETPPVDRQKTCPLLLRVFCANGRHNPPSEYNRGNVPTNELQVYTWMDASLRELTGLIKEVNPDARRRNTYYEFAIVYADRRASVYRSREIGITCSSQRGMDDNKSLASCKFEIGDYIDVAITVPGVTGGGRMMGGGGRGRDRRPY